MIQRMLKRKVWKGVQICEEGSKSAGKFGPGGIQIRRAFLMYVENLEMNNLLKWALFIKVSGQVRSDTLEVR